MKTKIQNIDYHGNLKKNGKWWRWIETCYRCGKTIYDYDHMSMDAPSTEKADFCSDCIQYLMQHDIPYKEAAKRYKKED